MSATMNSRDLSDPATMRDLAAKTGTVERLKLLTLMTYADISSVNPAAMTPWRRQLLWNLYTRTYAELTRELTARTSLPDTQAKPELREFLEGLPPRYLRTHNQDEIQGHLRLAQQSREKGVAASLTKSAAWVLDVVADDRPFLFASIAATLSSFGFNILKAEAFSNAHGKAIDRFTFADPTRTLDLNPDEANQLTRTVVKAIRGETNVDQLLARRPKVKADPRALAAASTVFDNEASPSATLIQLSTQDRPALLYDLASADLETRRKYRSGPGRYGSKEGHRRFLHYEGQGEAERSGCARDDGRFGRGCAVGLDPVSGVGSAGDLVAGFRSRYCPLAEIRSVPILDRREYHGPAGRQSE